MDFAGQVEYYVTHQLFLSDMMAIFILVSSFIQPQSPTHQSDFHQQSHIKSTNITSANHEIKSSNKPPTRNHHRHHHHHHQEYQHKLQYWMKLLKLIMPFNTKIPALVSITHLDHMEDQILHHIHPLKLQSSYPSPSKFAKEMTSLFDLPTPGDFSIFNPPLQIKQCVPLFYSSHHQHQQQQQQQKQQQQHQIQSKTTSTSTSTSTSKVSLPSIDNLLRELIVKEVGNIINETWIPKSYVDAQSVAIQLFEQFKQDKRSPILSLSNFKQHVGDQVSMLKDDPMMMERAVQYLHAVGTILLDWRSGMVV